MSDPPPDVEAGPDPGYRSRVRLVVVYGGQSAEHEISCVSAFHVLRAADPARYDVRVVGITTDGRWVDADSTIAALAPGVASLPSPDTILAAPVSAGALTAGPTPRPAALDPAAINPAALDSATRDPATRDPATRDPATRDPMTRDPMTRDPMTRDPMTRDPATRDPATRDPVTLDPVATVRAGGGAPVVVFPLLHGPNGEDGTVQGLFEVAGVPYVGAGVAGSAASMDKGLTKAILAAAHLPQVRALIRRETELDDLTAKTVEAELGWPVFVKPANLGSSIGISRVGDAVELAAALDLARRYDEWVVIEEAVTAREIEVGVLGFGAELRASVPGEIIKSRAFYDFEDKYLAGTATSQIPADLPAEVAQSARRMALEVCRALRIDGMARVDFFYEDPGRGLLVNEVNTIPGFTPISQFPQLWAATGVDYAALVDELVRIALVRHERRGRFESRRQLS